jgi:DNA-binding HxlR family transcriptional regulator
MGLIAEAGHHGGFGKAAAFRYRGRAMEKVMVNRLAKSFNCPTEFTLQVLGGKWKTVILCYLKIGPLRYADLRKLIPSLSDKVLSQRLHELVEAGLVERSKSGRPKGGDRSEVYALSKRGQSLGRILTELYAWGENNATVFGIKVGHPLSADGLPGCDDVT